MASVVTHCFEWFKWLQASQPLRCFQTTLSVCCLQNLQYLLRNLMHSPTDLFVAVSVIVVVVVVVVFIVLSCH